MPLKRLINSKTLNILGLNSGTSADGLDMALVAVSSRGQIKQAKFLAGRTQEYPRALRKRVLQAADSIDVNLDEFIYLDSVLGQFYGRLASDYIKKLTRKKMAVDAIASHGQTVRHLPKRTRRMGADVKGTLQLGSPDMIAAATGLAVVADFRQADIALGGEGAPITVSAMQRLLAAPDQSRLLVNIGGMSNYFYFPAGASRLKARASDCGPGNSLCDILSQELFRERFDRDGKRARRGRVSGRLVSALLRASFYSASTRSTGREVFGRKLAEKIMHRGKQWDLTNDDLMASVAELTAQSIFRKVKPLVRADKQLSKLYLTGGGRHNIFFINRLTELLPQLSIRLVDELGIDGDYIEAAAYAVMGEACIRSEPSLTDFSGRPAGAVRPVLGKIVQPPQRVKAE